MKCPKCHYISFGDDDRCRNCGYDFSLVSSQTPLDLPIHGDDQPAGPMADLQLNERQPGSLKAVSVVTPPVERHVERLRNRSSGVTPSGLDLPLFTGSDDAPLVTPPAVPRPPLSVRRGPPPGPAWGTHRSDEEGDNEPELDLEVASTDVGWPPRVVSAHTSVDTAASPETAPGGARLLAAAIDALILGTIDAAVVYFTLRLLGLQVSEIRALPPVPLVAFLLLLNGGYVTIFTTAGGQTIGKMAAGIRVVLAANTAAVPFGTATVRSAGCLLSLLPVGLGFVLAFVSGDGRALHDRLADTRVIKV